MSRNDTAQEGLKFGQDGFCEVDILYLKEQYQINGGSSRRQNDIFSSSSTESDQAKVLGALLARALLNPGGASDKTLQSAYGSTYAVLPNLQDSLQKQVIIEMFRVLYDKYAWVEKLEDIEKENKNSDRVGVLMTHLTHAKLRHS